MQCAEPVTGSSGMPRDGTKNRETKSQSRPGAVAITAMWSRAATLAMSGFRARTSSSVSKTAM